MIIYLDLAGISKGFYSSSVIRMETPKFVLVFDSGQCQQNVGIDNAYKADRRSSDAAKKFLVEEEVLAVFKLIKSYYYSRLEEMFTIPNYCYVIDLKEYESDLVPHYIRCNLMVALDKDLLQTCE